MSLSDVCPSSFDPELWKGIIAALEGDEEPIALFDADGTLWADDLGEAHLHVLADHALVSAGDAYEGLLDEYASRCAIDVDDGYAWGARICAELDEETLLWSAKEAWNRHRPKLLKPMADLVRALLEAGVDVAIVSASNRWIIEAAVSELGVGPEGVIAVDLERRDGKLTSEVVQPMPNGAGKVGAVKARFKGRPALAFGNSVHDVPMLTYARQGALVLATHAAQSRLSEELEAARGAHGWLYIPLVHPGG